MINIPVIINGTYQANLQLSDQRNYSGLQFRTDNTLTPDQIEECQLYFASKYTPNQGIGILQDTYETTV